MIPCTVFAILQALSTEDRKHDPVDWYNSRPSPAIQRQIRDEVEQMVPKAPFAPSGSLIAPFTTALQAFSKDPQNDEKLLRITLMYSYFRCDPGLLLHSQYRAARAQIHSGFLDKEDFTLRRKKVQSYELIRAFALFLVEREGGPDVFYRTDIIERIRRTQPDPWLIELLVWKNLYGQTDRDPDMHFAQKVQPILDAYPRFRFRFLNASMSIDTVRAVRSKNRTLLKRAMNHAKVLEQWCPPNHPIYQKSRYRGYVIGWQRLLDSWPENPRP